MYIPNMMHKLIAAVVSLIFIITSKGWRWTPSLLRAWLLWSKLQKSKFGATWTCSCHVIIPIAYLMDNYSIYLNLLALSFFRVIIPTITAGQTHKTGSHAYPQLCHQFSDKEIFYQNVIDMAFSSATCGQLWQLRDGVARSCFASYHDYDSLVLISQTKKQMKEPFILYIQGYKYKRCF